MYSVFRNFMAYSKLHHYEPNTTPLTTFPFFCIILPVMATTSKKSSQTKKTTKSDTKPKKKSAAKSSAASKKSDSAKKTTVKASTTKKAAAARSTSKKTSENSRTTSAAKTKSRSRTARTRKLRYKKGQEIVYPLQGVGQITTIEERVFRSTKLLYYIIYLEVSDMTIMVPVNKADELGIRPIVDKRQANKALKLISEEYEPVPTDWKARYQNNLDLLKKGSVLDIATVVRALYHRSRIKELPILERKLYDSALKLLVDEISFSLQKEKDEVEELVLSKMEVN
jgi:CarD family transcriptional regulator